MKLKKAKKMLKKLGVTEVLIREKGHEPRDNEKDVVIKTDTPHEFDNAEVVGTTLSYDDFEITYKKSPSKKEKKAKKKIDRKSAYDAEIARIQRNLEFVKTGKGVYEESQEEIAKREEQKQENEENQRNRQQQRNNNRNNDGRNQSDRNNAGNNHHQNQNAIRNNRRRNNRSYNNNSHTKESGTNEVTTKPEYPDKKEE